jgi:hypothetical protein
MKPDLYWRRLVDAYRRRRVRRLTASLADKSQLAAELLETLSPGVLYASGHLRRRVVRRRVTMRVRPR